MKIDKNIVVKCKNLEEVKDCLNKLKELGFKIKEMDEDKSCLIIASSVPSRIYFRNYKTPSIDINHNVVSYDYFFKLYKKQKSQQADFEVAEDGRIIKINNSKSKKQIFLLFDNNNLDNALDKFFHIQLIRSVELGKYIELGLVYATAEARDKAMFKLEIETKLKNIAERLNAGRKIDWEDVNQNKIYIFYDFKFEILNYNYNFTDKEQGKIFCLDENFLSVAKQEIGEENLIKYFTE